MTDIYEQHRAAFANVSAYVIMKDAERVATIAFKYPKDGAGRLWAYVHWIGLPMMRGYASGYGYDKASAACSVAAAKLISYLESPSRELPFDFPLALCRSFTTELHKDDGHYWNDRLRDTGFEVWQAV